MKSEYNEKKDEWTFKLSYREYDTLSYILNQVNAFQMYNNDTWGVDGLSFVLDETAHRAFQRILKGI